VRQPGMRGRKKRKVRPLRSVYAEQLRRKMVTSAIAKLRRDLEQIGKLAKLDPSVVLAAIDTFASPMGAGQWLITPAFGLNGEIPVEIAATLKGRLEVISLLHRIEYGVLS
jgi:uncharacterized protein (DUF2384 family)